MFKFNIGTFVTAPVLGQQQTEPTRRKGIVVARSMTEDVNGRELMYHVFFKDSEASIPFQEEELKLLNQVPEDC